MQPEMATHRTAQEVARSDRRWLLAVIAVFAASMAVFFGAYQIYRATGPHPEVTLLLRRAKGVAKRILPRWQRNRP
jgi:hypothetical protein